MLLCRQVLRNSGSDQIRISVTLDTIQGQTNLDREATVKAVHALEEKQVISAFRSSETDDLHNQR